MTTDQSDIRERRTSTGAAVANDRTQPEPPYCGRCEWDGIRLVRRCFLCARDRKAMTDRG